MSISEVCLVIIGFILLTRILKRYIAYASRIRITIIEAVAPGDVLN